MDLVQIMALLRQQALQIEKLNAQVAGLQAQVRLLKANDEKITEFVNGMQDALAGRPRVQTQTEEDAIIVE